MFVDEGCSTYVDFREEERGVKSQKCYPLGEANAVNLELSFCIPLQGPYWFLRGAFPQSPLGMGYFWTWTLLKSTKCH